MKCQLRRKPKPVWNELVHSVVFRLALEGHWRDNDIAYCKMRTATVHLKENLLPTVDGRMV